MSWDMFCDQRDNLGPVASLPGPMGLSYTMKNLLLCGWRDSPPPSILLPGTSLLEQYLAFAFHWNVFVTECSTVSWLWSFWRGAEIQQLGEDSTCVQCDHYGLLRGAHGGVGEEAIAAVMKGGPGDGTLESSQTEQKILSNYNRNALEQRHLHNKYALENRRNTHMFSLISL